MAYRLIKYETAEGILTITLNRPDSLNALNYDMINDLMDALNTADADDDIRVIIVTGAGHAFCAGADLSQGDDSFVPKSHAGKETTAETYRDWGGTLSLKIYDMKKPFIAAINGAAVGVGITFTLPMDIRLATETAKIGFPFTRRGIVPDAASSWFLPRIVGVSKAMEWILSGRIFKAQEALSGGLVMAVLKPDELIAKAQEIATEIIRNTSSVSVSLSRQLIWKMMGSDHPMEAHRIESKLLYWITDQPDVNEGIQSFLEKRSPKFPMKVSTDLPKFYPWWPNRPFR